MDDKLKVSFNSPQCGFMSIGLTNTNREFHTTTAHAPWRGALPEMMNALTDLLESKADEFLIQWNRDPEEFDFELRRDGGAIELKVWQYAGGNRARDERELVFEHHGDTLAVAKAFWQTFSQMNQDQNVDEFEQNWRQPFPQNEFERFDKTVKAAILQREPAQV